MPLILSGSGGISGVTGTFGKETMPVGSVLQVVSVSSQTAYSTTSTSFVNTFTASITPISSTNKILILINCSLYCSGSGGSGIALIRNGNNNIWLPSTADASGPYGALYGVASGRFISSMSYLDSPATTSLTTYGIGIAGRASLTTVLNQADGSNNGGSTITLMEIKA